MAEIKTFAWHKETDLDNSGGFRSPSGSVELWLFSGSSSALREQLTVWSDGPGIKVAGPDLPPTAGRKPARVEVGITIHFHDDLATAITINPRSEPLSSEYLRRFPYGRWLRVAAALWRISQEDTGWSLVHSGLEGRSAPKAPGRVGYPDEHWQAVADGYQEFLTKGERAPTALIGELWGVSRNTAAGWIRKCRQLGLLPPARPGRAG